MNEVLFTLFVVGCFFLVSAWMGSVERRLRALEQERDTIHDEKPEQ